MPFVGSKTQPDHPNMTYKTYAKWSPSAYSHHNGVTSDTHQTEAAAQGVRSALHRHGFGGEGKHFPLETWVESIDEDGQISPTHTYIEITTDGQGGGLIVTLAEAQKFLLDMRTAHQDHGDEESYHFRTKDLPRSQFETLPEFAGF